MTNDLNQGRIFLTIAFIVLLIGGCANTRPAKFYTLNSISNPNEGQPERDLSIEVGPVEIPDYLDRPHLVTRTSQNELRISDFHKWAGSLNDDISRVIVENLSSLLSSDNVYIYPWAQSIPVSYRVRVKVNRFEGVLGEQVVLKAYWSIYGENGKQLLARDSSGFYEDTGKGGYNDTVAAMSRAIEKLSSEIADAIRSLSGE
jgi:uncharacterized lipoprotein YmbA